MYSALAVNSRPSLQRLTKLGAEVKRLEPWGKALTLECPLSTATEGIEVHRVDAQGIVINSSYYYGSGTVAWDK